MARLSILPDACRADDPVRSAERARLVDGATQSTIALIRGTRAVEDQLRREELIGRARTSLLEHLDLPAAILGRDVEIRKLEAALPGSFVEAETKRLAEYRDCRSIADAIETVGSSVAAIALQETRRLEQLRTLESLQRRQQMEDQLHTAAATVILEAPKGYPNRDVSTFVELSNAAAQVTSGLGSALADPIPCSEIALLSSLPFASPDPIRFIADHWQDLPGPSTVADLDLLPKQKPIDFAELAEQSKAMVEGQRAAENDFIDRAAKRLASEFRDVLESTSEQTEPKKARKKGRSLDPGLVTVTVWDDEFATFEVAGAIVRRLNLSDLRPGSRIRLIEFAIAGGRVAPPDVNALHASWSREYVDRNDRAPPPIESSEQRRELVKSREAWKRATGRLNEQLVRRLGLTGSPFVYVKASREYESQFQVIRSGDSRSGRTGPRRSS